MIRKIPGRVALVGLLLALGANDASAQMGPRYDLDGDGKVTKGEFRKARVQQIMRLDRDKDGRVTRAESEAAETLVRTIGGKGAVARIEDLWVLGDTNHDRLITTEEASALADKRFPLYDTTSDGWLSRAEMVAASRGAPAMKALATK